MPPLKPIEPQPGSSIDPEDFVGRRDTTRTAITMFTRGTDILLSDPRRLGKTSWLDYLVACVDDVDAVKIDYEGVSTTDAFLMRTAEALMGHAPIISRGGHALSRFFENVGAEVSLAGLKVKTGLEGESRLRLLERTVRAVDAEGARPLVVAMDEVPAAILNIAHHESPEEAGALLQCLRSLRTSTRHVRWIVCGSVGFHHVLHEASSTEGVLGDLQHLPFGPLDARDADELAQRLFSGIGRQAPQDALDALAAVTDGVPYFMHLVAQRLEASGATGSVGADEVTASFDDFIRDRDASKAATHLVTRIEAYYGPLAKPAMKLLDHVARGQAPGPDDAMGVADDDERTRMLDLLSDDHYIVTAVDGTLSWRYDVLRRIWVVRRRLR